MFYPIILAGGVGTRLWPLSRSAMPKQFVEFSCDQQSLFTATLQRLAGLSELGPPTVVCNAEHRFLVAEQSRQSAIDKRSILLEPVGRNTAPAIAVAAFHALTNDPDAILLVLPADHIIEDRARFQVAVRQAQQLAGQGRLVTFGIVPDSPQTGYGYIQKGSDLNEMGGCEVSRFLEKPDLSTAQTCLQDGGYFWNSGMFVFPAQTFLGELQRLAPDIHAACQQCCEKLEADNDFIYIPENEFAQCRSESVDYAVMEKTDLAAMITLDAGWSDLGSWDAYWEHAAKDGQGNSINGDVVSIDSTNSYINAQSRLVATIGLDNIVLVETTDSVLVADKSRVQAVKDLVVHLQQLGRKEKDHHALVFRPWGSFESLAQGKGYQVKHIIVNPGAAISLQRHQHRSEHWTVVKGSALVHCDGRDFTVKKNESTFIPLGIKHRLSNPDDVPVELIEVQVGEYLGEDDIERFEDIYGR